MPGLNENVLGSGGRMLVGFSGGPDSLCLLLLLAESRWRTAVQAIHIDHGLDPDSSRRAAEAVRLAEHLGLACRVERVEVERRHPEGPEAAARHARYACLKDLMAPGDTLLTAHHADDQVETVLLRLLRGAGPRGLAGIRSRRRFGPGWLARPLLHWRRAEILERLARAGLEPVLDPANEDLRPDRNYLRHEVLPLLMQRWPGAREAILQAARWQADAASALYLRADRDLARLIDEDPRTLRLAELCNLPDGRALAAVRRWCERQIGKAPRHRMLSELLRQCREARPDRVPRLVVGSAILRAWHGRLWLDSSLPTDPNWQLDWSGGEGAEPILLLPDGSRLHWRGGERKRLGRTWTVTGPRPGDRLALHPAGPRRRVKDLAREAGIPPWRRPLLPCLRVDGRLVAIGDELLDPEFSRALESNGSRLEWRRAAAAVSRSV